MANQNGISGLGEDKPNKKKLAIILGFAVLFFLLIYSFITNMTKDQELSTKAEQIALQKEVLATIEQNNIKAREAYSDLVASYHEAFKTISEFSTIDKEAVDTLIQAIEDPDLEREKFENYSQTLNEWIDKAKLDIDKKIKSEGNKAATLRRRLVNFEKRIETQRSTIMTIKKEYQTQIDQLQGSLTAQQNSAQASAEMSATELKKLQEKLAAAEEQIKQLETEKEQANKEVSRLKKDSSALTTKIAATKEEARKVSIVPYFMYKEGSKRKENQIELANSPLPVRYYNYFFSKKQDIHVTFALNPDFFKSSPIKVNVELYGDKEAPLVAEVVSIHDAKPVTIVIPHDKFEKEKTYNLHLKHGGKDLIKRGSYVFALQKQ